MKQGRNVDNSENVVLAFQTSGMWGKWSELQKSERRKPKRTPKTKQTITTSKVFLKAFKSIST